MTVDQNNQEMMWIHRSMEYMENQLLWKHGNTEIWKRFIKFHSL